ncbi:MAG: Gfo/Idh/MocA family oxidoreductase [Bacteroidia bacterium]|nr:Gfo/Idh/MocA family oxidoreductase [Bacteroidia bacterium]
MKKIQGETVNWGIIGVGDVCEVKSAPAMNKIPGSRIEIVMRRNAAKVEDYAKRHGISRWTTDADAVINDPKVNAIYIATPPQSHREYALKAAAAGKPAYVEKPMARTYEECKDMVLAFEEAEIPLYVAYYRRTLPNCLFVKELLEKETIGDIRMLKIEMVKPLQPDLIANSEENWRVDPEIAGGGYFFDLASHQLDLMDFLFGPIGWVDGHGGNQAGIYPANDIVVSSFRFENGIMGTGSWCFNAGASGHKEMTEIIGSRGIIRFPTFGKPWVEVELDSGEKDKSHFIMPQHIQQPLIENIVAELLGKGTSPSTGQSAIRTNYVMGQMIEKD